MRFLEHERSSETPKEVSRPDIQLAWDHEVNSLFSCLHCLVQKANPCFFQITKPKRLSTANASAGYNYM